MTQVVKTEKGNYHLFNAHNGYHFASVCQNSGGWKVYPHSAARQPSRKIWPDPVSAVNSMFGPVTAAALQRALKE